jgi:uncharacterized protein
MSDLPEAPPLGGPVQVPPELAPAVPGTADAAPVPSSERFESIDVVRGFALLGILAINIINFGLPEIAQSNPAAVGGFEGANFVAWFVCHLLFEEKMFTLFSMLFGAGLVLMTGRAEARGQGSAKLFYRRAGFLLLIGLLHGYFLWEGDILFFYAVCGMAIYPLRRKSPGILLILGGLALLTATLLSVGIALLLGWIRRHLDVTGFGLPGMETPEKIAEQIRLRSEGSYWQIFQARALQTGVMQTAGLLLSLFWLSAGRMLIGIALMKRGVFSAERSRPFYVWLLLAGYGLGLPLVALGAYEQIRHRFDFVYYLGAGRAYNDFGSLFVALGHAAALILVYKAGALRWLTGRLAAVGRMALTNYLAQTVLCTTLFYGYGLGLYGMLDRVQLFGVVAAIWALQLVYSPIWLRYFRFGPAEWLWRSLTYWRAQPLLRGVPASGWAPS